MRRRPTLVLAVTAALATTALATTALGAAASSATADTHRDPPARGGIGTWTKVSSGLVAIGDQPSLVRTSNGVLHLVYANGSSSGVQHTSITTAGATAGHSAVLATAWSEVVPDPIVVPNGSGGLRVVFSGIQGTDIPHSTGQMYGASSVDGGTGWSLDGTVAGQSIQAHSQDGTAATALTDGTPVSGFALNGQLVWHVGETTGADDVYNAPAGITLSHPTFVRDASNAVWAGWLQQGSTAATTGFFAMQIEPTLGTPQKAPGSSDGTQTVTWLTRTPLAARVGGGVFEAYCVGAPNCSRVRIWKVGTTKTADVPASRFASTIALAPGPGGRLWVAWGDNIPRIRAVRTGTDGLALGAVRTPGTPRGHSAVQSLAIEGSRMRADIVLNVGDGLWHTQVDPGLTLSARPHAWRHGSRQKVVFTATDAHAAVRGVRVKVGSAHCTTGRAGTCSITFPRTFAKGKHAAKATKSGYAAGTAGLKVR